MDKPDESELPGAASLARSGDQVALTPVIGAAYLKVAEEIGAALKQMFAAVGETQKALAVQWVNAPRVGSTVVGALGRIFKDADKADAVLKAGWVPHTTTPMAQFESGSSTFEIDALLRAHYETNWAETRIAMSQSICDSGVDAEAVATFEEALTAHEAGLYRSVVRLLFPEIERVARETVYQGSRKEPSNPRKNNAGLKDLRVTVSEDFPAGVALFAPYAMTLFNKFCNHLYEYVPDTAESVALFAADPVPNRHASQHGYVTYSTSQHSFNMLAMTDYMLNMIMRAHAHMERRTVAQEA